MSARAGNVIGGGDWAEDRIVPDAIRALQKVQPIPVRNPKSVRPWQHVLEPLSGYLTLGAALGGSARLRGSKVKRLNGVRSTPQQINNSTRPAHGSFNFGPNRDANRTVKELVEEILENWPGEWKQFDQKKAPHEAGLLQLDNSLAQRELGWKPRWSFGDAIAETVGWYRDVFFKTLLPIEATRQQIRRYLA